MSRGSKFNMRQNVAGKVRQNVAAI